MCPPAPAIGRLAVRDLVVDGFRIRKGTNVFVGCYALHHDPAKPSLRSLEDALLALYKRTSP